MNCEVCLRDQRYRSTGVPPAPEGKRQRERPPIGAKMGHSPTFTPTRRGEEGKSEAFGESKLR